MKMLEHYILVLPWMLLQKLLRKGAAVHVKGKMKEVLSRDVAESRASGTQETARIERAREADEELTELLTKRGKRKRKRRKLWHGHCP